MTEKERMEAGLLYDPGDGEVLAEQRQFAERLREFNDLRPSGASRVKEGSGAPV